MHRLPGEREGALRVAQVDQAARRQYEDVRVVGVEREGAGDVVLREIELPPIDVHPAEDETHEGIVVVEVGGTAGVIEGEALLLVQRSHA